MTIKTDDKGKLRLKKTDKEKEYFWLQRKLLLRNTKDNPKED